MNPNELKEIAVNAINEKTNMTLVLPRPWKQRPKDFPKGYLLCQQEKSNVYSFNPEKILNWLLKHSLIVDKQK